MEKEIEYTTFAFMRFAKKIPVFLLLFAWYVSLILPMIVFLIAFSIAYLCSVIMSMDKKEGNNFLKVNKGEIKKIWYKLSNSIWD